MVLVAAGSGQRLGHGIPKARVLCAGRTLLEHALGAALSADIATSVVAVLPAEDAVLTEVVERAARRSVAGGSAVRITAVPGGPTRTASVRAGLDALPGSTTVVLIHDAARALTPAGVFREVTAAVAAGMPAVIPVLPVVDTVKTVDGNLVTGTPDRAGLRAVQTPQGFDATLLRSVHGSALAQAPGITDDAMLMEVQGIPVHVVPGHAHGFKVTTPLDLVVAEAVLALRSADGHDATGPTAARATAD